MALSEILPLRKFFIILFGAIIMTLASLISIDIGPVPFTLQTAGVHFLAMSMTPGCAFLSVLLWMTCSVFGCPLFALCYSGAKSICGPTGGYLWGMLLTVPFISMCQFRWAKFFNDFLSKSSQKNSDDLHFFPSIVVGCISNGCILFWGWAYLGWCYGYDYAFEKGVLPFLLPGMLKVIFTSSVIHVFRLSKLFY